ncbi:hypothetical protein IAT38_007419 [Cryptococcus sp. DSM 104549]
MGAMIFIGCIDSTYDIIGSIEVSLADYENGASANNCATACYTQTTPYMYSYFTSDETCYCSMSPPAGSEIKSSTDSINRDTCADTSDTTPRGLSADLLLIGGVQLAAIVTPLSTGSYDCSCYDSYSVSVDSYTTCGLGVPFIYGHIGSTTLPSGWVKRAQRKRQWLQQKEMEGLLCPVGLDACRVGADDASGYECIDTLRELESCGGCVHGRYGKETAGSGLDCSTMDGVSQYSSTCNQGACQAFACEDGWFLNANQTCLSLTAGLSVYTV